MTARVWDRFLTEQDRVAAVAAKTSKIGFGKRPALLLIDLYRWVFGDKPEPLLESTKAWPGSCGLAGWNALPHIQKLLAAAREVGIPVAHVTGLMPEESGIPSWSANDKARRSGLDPAAMDRRRRRFDIVTELKPIPGEVFLRKVSPSVFWGTPLIGHLHSLGVDTLITCGESTSGCVRASVVDGCTYRFRMVVVEECVFDRTEASHAINLFDMSQKYADVVPLTEALRYLREWKEQHAAEAGGQKEIRVAA